MLVSQSKPTQPGLMLKNLMQGRQKPVLLVMDGLPVHNAKSVAQYVQSTQGRLKRHFLPSSAPDLSPDEFVWSHSQPNGTIRKPLHQKGSTPTTCGDGFRSDQPRSKPSPVLI
jgi:hypothetical protein